RKTHSNGTRLARLQTSSFLKPTGSRRGRGFRRRKKRSFWPRTGRRRHLRCDVPLTRSDHYPPEEWVMIGAVLAVEPPVSRAPIGRQPEKHVIDAPAHITAFVREFRHRRW